MMPQKAEIQSQELQDYLDSSSSFYQELLGYKPEQTSLQQIPETQWNEFAQGRGLNSNSSGIYLPRNQTAIIKESSPLSLFHEYFGHGLYCEQSLSGIRLVNLEKKLLEEEKQEFSNSKFSLKDLQRFRKNNKTFQELNEFKNENLGVYESFAVFTEYLLSNKFNIKETFEKKYNNLSKQDKEGLDKIIGFNKSYGDLATFYGFGLKKIQDKKRLLKLSKEMLRRALNKTRLIIHFGSGKPFSDVDLFVISNYIGSLYSDHWIDIRAYKLKDVEDKIELLEPKIIFPIMEGKFLFGDKKYLAGIRKKILKQRITERAINYNLEEWRYHYKRFLDSSLGRYLQNKNLRSSKIYLANALALKKGDKVLTFKNLINYTLKRFSHSEKFIELKGGIK